ncbi:MAG: PilZ domain-containing protein [Ectothiorhodospiraceae bacterium]|nr:PilZ domain-containing protein [Ectothiorhodospiraceae bacterium]
MDVRKGGSGHGKQGVLNLTIQDKAALYKAYMPYVKGGGLFVPLKNGDPIQDSYRLGDDVFVLVSLQFENEKVPVVGKVIWITPRGAQGNRSAGIGLQFSDRDNGAARAKFENLLAGSLEAERPTHTM